MWYLLRLVVVTATLVYMWLHIDWQIALFCTLTTLTLEMLLRYLAELANATNIIAQEVKKIKEKQNRSL